MFSQITHEIPEMQRKSPNERRWLQLVLGSAVIVLLAGLIRWRATKVDGLWLDEVFGAAYTNLGFFEVMVAVLRFDIHPPFFYMQLWLWSQVSVSDDWLLLNSVAWSVATVVAVIMSVKNQTSIPQTLLAGVLCALVGSEIYFASELRMYAMMSCLTVVAWGVINHWIDAGGRLPALMIGALFLALSATHSAAFIAIGALLVYLWMLVLMSPNRHQYLRGGYFLTLSAAAFLFPWLLNASFRSVSHAGEPSVDIIQRTISGWVLGYFPGQSLFLTVLSLAVVCLSVIVALFAGGRARKTVIAFVLFPVVAVALISIFLRPIWLDRTLAFVAPFVVIALILSLSKISILSRLMVSGIALSTYVLVFVNPYGVWDGINSSRKMQFREVAAYIQRNNIDRLDVYAPENVRYWGIARYLIGPRWGSLLEVQDPLLVDGSSTWPRIYKYIGQRVLEALNLVPRTRFVEVDGYRLWIGLSILPSNVLDRGYWFVGDMKDAAKISVCISGEEKFRQVFRGVLLVQCGPKLNNFSLAYEALSKESIWKHSS